MRDKFGVLISVIIALSLLYFIAPMDDIMTLFGANSNVVGEINGKKISHEDFLTEVDKYTTVYEISSGSSTQNEETQKQIRNAAWQHFLDSYLFIPSANKAGIHVGADELVALIKGDQVSPIVSSNPIFADENGQFNPKAVEEFVSNIDADDTGRLRAYWKYLQEMVSNQQYSSKYNALFCYSNVENALMLKYDVAANNTSAIVDYVFTPYGYERDSTIEVSKTAIQNYYNDHKKMYKQGNSRDIRYVVFEVTPSTEDIAELSNEMNAAYEEFKVAENLKAFLQSNSDSKLSDYWYKKGELATKSSALSAFVDEAGVGEVSEICVEGESFFAAKVTAVAPRSESAQVKIISAAGATEITDSLLNVLNLSQEMELTQSRMVPGCEKLLDAQVGVPQLVESRMYGTLLAEVISKTEPVTMKQVAILEKTVLPGNKTKNECYAKASDFAVMAAGTAEGYNRAVDSLGTYSHKMNITEATEAYGSIDNAKEITRWAFEAKKGKASNIITVNNKYFFVVTLDAIHKEGYKSVGEVSESIKEQLYQKEFKSKKAAEVKAKIAGLQTIDEVAEKLGGVVNAAQEINFSTMGNSIEPAAVGAMYVAPENQICGPVKAENGTYVFKVNSKQTSEFYTAEDAKNLQMQKTSYNAQYSLSNVMMMSADVEDNRARFF